MQSVSSAYLNKSDLRCAILAELKLLTAKQKDDYSAEIQTRLTAKLSAQVGTYWAAFQPMGFEPKITWSTVSQKIQWCFPLVIGNNLFFKHSVGAFQKNHWGFNEPVDGVLISTNELTGLVIPGLAYDLAGTRLGRGQGYFDRALKNYTGFKIGVCFNLALRDHVFAEDHDLRCHSILTEIKTVEIEGVKSWN